jgi:hypothetical protein
VVYVRKSDVLSGKWNSPPMNSGPINLMAQWEATRAPASRRSTAFQPKRSHHNDHGPMDHRSRQKK